MGRDKWNKRQQAAFLKSLGTLLIKGYSISDSLTLLGLQNHRNYFQIQTIKEELKKGVPLFESLEKQKIPPDILGYLFFASEQGNLSFGLLQGSAILLKREELKKNFLQSIRYPTVLLGTLVVMMFFMVRFLFPQFSMLFESVNLSLPLVTRHLISFMEIIPVLLYLTITFLVLFFLMYHFRFKHRTSHDKLHFWMRFPFLRGPCKTVLTYYFAFQLGHLLKGGLSLSQALQLFAKQSYLKIFQEEAVLLKVDLRMGRSLNEIFKDKSYFLPELAQVTFFGQSNGKLGEELILYSEMLLENTEDQLQRMMTLIQPVLFAIIGSIVLILFLSVMVPVFKLFQSL